MRKTLAAVAIAFGMMVGGCADDSLEPIDEPPPEFMASKIITPRGGDDFPFGEYSVSEFVEMLKKVQLDNGEYMEPEGWFRDDNLYMLDVTGRGNYRIVFLHLLSEKTGGGAYSHMKAVGDVGDVLGTSVMETVVLAQ